METQMYFWKPLMGKHKKQLRIVEHYFNKTKVQFDDIEQEAKEHENMYFRNYPSTEYTDESAVAEWALEAGLEMYETLLLMKSNHLLMTISMLYHIWEQQIIKFTMQEMSHYFIFKEKSMEYREVQKLFELHGVNITETNVWNKIKELKLLTNTIKHGDGESAKKLRKMRPDFFGIDLLSDTSDILELNGAVLLDGFSIRVKENDFTEYLQATTDFWDEMPERAFSDVDLIIEAFDMMK